jgi:rSAM/selenodomain-associated transferase 1
MKRAIVIMAKVPSAGTVKTRLKPFLAPEQCAGLAASFLQDAESKSKSVCENTIVAYSPADKREVLESILQTENILVEQNGANLGERMSNAFKFAFAQNSDAVVMVGTDSPTFPAEFIERAFKFLESGSDIVLGKAEDGGFYLIGLREFVPRLFENIQWSSPTVFEETSANAAKFGLKNLTEIPAWYDVDISADLLVLRNEFLSDEAIQKRASATYRWLLAHSELF